MRYGVSFSVAALGAMLGTSALAAVEITSVTVTADGKTSQHTIYLTPDVAKIDTEGNAIIIHTDTGRMANLLKDKHEYMEIDLKETASRMAAAQARMQQQLQTVPEAQRKQIEAMLAQHGGMPGAQPPGAQPKEPAVEIGYEKTDQTKMVGSWSCQVFHRRMGGDLVADLCIARAAAVGLTRDDLAAVRTLAETMSKSLPGDVRRNGGMMDFDAQTRQIGFEGIPVETVSYLGGKVRTTTTVKSVDHAPLSPDIFKVPAGYVKMEMPGHAP